MKILFNLSVCLSVSMVWLDYPNLSASGCMSQSVFRSNFMVVFAPRYVGRNKAQWVDRATDRHRT